MQLMQYVSKESLKYNSAKENPSESVLTACGEIERKIFSCQEMSPIRHWAKNPGNTAGKQVVGETGVIRGVVDSYGWYEVPFTITDSNGKEITAFGGASASRQAVYKDGVFHHWSGWPEDDGKNNLSPGWGWNFAQIGMCESSV